jgi:3',5'-cyclic AMP phosphodiesterase CpdA
MTRREVLGSLAAAGAGALAASAAAQPGERMAGAGGAARKRTLRFAHLTDSHIQPERGAVDGVGACLDHAMALSDKPQLVVTGGDLIMDGFEATRERTALQWDLFTRIYKDRCGVPVEHTLGNHDIWGWNQRKSRTTSEEAQWGKRWALDALGAASAYRVVERGAWRIVILDSVAPHRGDGYIARLDDEQAAWLDGALASAARDNKHVAVVSHIPILSVSVFDLDAEVRDEDWVMRGGVMHVDAKRIFTMFRRHGCVKLAISGHIHKLDRCEYDGVTYICDGAVSGAWWKGPGERVAEGYGVFDLFDDGGFEHAYMTYGWSAREA